MDTVRLEKKLCAALRHRPQDFDLVLDDGGFTAAEDVCRAFGISMEMLEMIVANSDKQRFELKDGRIRALYGHSVEVRIEREAIVPPEILYHGTARRFTEKILQEGLKPMKRQYVHLSQEKQIAEEVGKRRDPHPVILIIDAKRAYADGVAFYEGNQRNVLADYVAPRYITVEQRERKSRN